MKEFYRAYAEVDLQAIRHNINEIKKVINAKTKIMSVVKANAYGHGAIQVAGAIDNIVEMFGVAIIEEAMELRKAGFQKDTIILGYCHKEWYEQLIEHNLIATVFTVNMAKDLSEVAVSMGKKARVHIKLDTGMNRIGFSPTMESANDIKMIHQLPGINLEGIFTHMAKSDEKDLTEAKNAIDKYNEFIKCLEQLDIDIQNKHVSNSAAVIGLPEANYDMVRCGISIYGVYPSDEVSREVLKLRPAMGLNASISYIKKVPKGSPISYGGTFVTKRETVVATVAIGYADGMKRDLSNKGRVLVKGKFIPIIGRICMDQFMIDVTEINEVTEGDEVTIFGANGGKEILVEEVSEMAHSFSYEFLCNVSMRIPRRYINYKENSDL